MVYWTSIRRIVAILFFGIYFVDFSAFSFFYLLYSACVVTTRIEKAVKSIKLRNEEGKYAQKMKRPVVKPACALQRRLLWLRK